MATASVWRARAVIPRLFIGLTCLVIAIQFLFALLTWDGQTIKRESTASTNDELDLVHRRKTDDAAGGVAADTNSEKCSCGVEQTVDQEKARLLGKVRSEEGFLTIGIPTIKRQNGSYLFNTLDSLINCTSAEDKKEVVLVIFLADFDSAIKGEMAREIEEKYYDHIEDGFIHVIDAPKSFYATFDNLKRTYNHPEDKVKWRSKQNYDYAYLLKYSSALSTYYMQLEDDVETMHNYVTAVKHYIRDQTTPWVCLEFSTLGYIGKLYHSQDIDKLAKMLMLFYQEQPPDFLYLYFNVFLTQFQQRLRVPTLFQHMGYHSSLPNKVQPLKDKLFDNTVKLYHGDNPPASIYTNLKTFVPFFPNSAYSLADGFFWAEESKKGDSMLLVFDRPEKLSSIFIDTGSEYHKTDRIYNGTLEAGVTLLNKTPDSAECTNYVHLGEFIQGNIRVKNLSSVVPFDIFCFRIRLTSDHKNWLIVREIAVFR